MGRLLHLLAVCAFAWVVHPHPHAPRYNHSSHPKHPQSKPAQSAASVTSSTSSAGASDEDGPEKQYGDATSGGKWQLGDDAEDESSWLRAQSPLLPLWGPKWPTPEDVRLRTPVWLTRDDFRTKRNFGLEIPDVIMAKFDGGDGQHVRDRLNHMGKKK